MHTPRITIDHNSIVALEKVDAQDLPSPKDIEIATAMKGILGLAADGKVSMVIPAIGASEKQKHGKRIANFKDFKAKLQRLGIVPSEYSLPEFRLSMSFIGHAKLGLKGPEWLALQQEIKAIIHPSMDWNDTKHKNWLNRYCDVATMFAHLQANADLFITDDKTFLSDKKKKALLALGANMIECAADALELISKDSVLKAAPLDLPHFDDAQPLRHCIYIPPNAYDNLRELRRKKGLPSL